MRGVLIILDGVGDRPCRLLNGLSPLEAAKTPNLDWLAERSIMGTHQSRMEGLPQSDEATIKLLGNDLSKQKISRGIIEAVGAGIKLEKLGDYLAFRADFATIDKKTRRIIDRRVGRTLTSKEAKKLSEEINKKVKLLFEFKITPTVQHRGVLVIKGNLSQNISDTDPEYEMLEPYIQEAKPLDERIISKYTAELINYFTKKSSEVLEEHPINKERRRKGLLPANAIIMRGAGTKKPTLKNHSDWRSVNYMPVERGIAILSGMKTTTFQYPKIHGEDVYKTLHEGLKKACKVATITLDQTKEKYLYIHIKETDIPGHDGNPYEKKKMLEEIDELLMGKIKELVKEKGIKVIITGDHATPCEMKGHSKDQVPIMLIKTSSHHKTGRRFNEKEAKKGELGMIHSEKLLEVCEFS
ncbi:MAG: 2,3-bisphosphoglycerate-independent phosphoglycerate mutase [Nanoarchaeota archaeon]